MLTNKKTKKVAIITTHPIQYYAPVFTLLSRKTELYVFYTNRKMFDKGFRQKVQWDIPLLDGYSYIFADKNLINKLIAFKPDCLIVYGWANMNHLAVMRYFKGKVPILFRGDSTLLNPQNILKSKCRSIALNFIYKQIDKALYVGQNNKTYFIRHGLKQEQLIFAPHAVDNKRFSAPIKSNIRNLLHLKSNDILVLYAGKFTQVKNPQLLLRGFIELSMPNVHILFTGDGLLKNSLQNIGRGYRNVHFLPFQNQSKMPAIYQACDLFCLPSNSESWGLAVNEAMAAGKAILASDKVGAAADLVRAENGRIFKNNNLPDLKKNLQEMVSNPRALQEKGKASSKIIADWNFDVQANNILDAID